MNKSDWIALGALLVAFVGLIPQYYQAFSSKQKKKTISRTKDITTKSIEIQIPDNNKEELKTKAQPPMIRILIFLVLAVIIGLIELIIFSAIAYYFDVKVDMNTMPLLWKIFFYSLFVIPGILFVYASMVFTTMFDK